MKIETLSYLYDAKSECSSILVQVDIKDYFDFIDTTYKNEGNIEGQRGALKTQTAKRIRNQMVEDFRKGSVFPPIVIGIEFNDNKDFKNITPLEFQQFLLSVPETKKSILDGIQRTTAMMESGVKENHQIRIEFWIAKKLHALLYRMLVLNTGQVPWTLRRQIEVVFQSLKDEIKTKIPTISLGEVDKVVRRTSAGTYQTDKIIEAFLIFGTRSGRIDTKEKLAEEFLKLDFIENSTDQELTDIFISVLKLMVDFDHSLGSITSNNDGRFTSGYDLFGSQTFLTGYIAAAAFYILGRPRTFRSVEEKKQKLNILEMKQKDFIEKIEKMEPDQKNEFIALDFLNEQMDTFKKGSKVGDEERTYFSNCFKVLFEENFTVENMEVCWSA